MQTSRKITENIFYIGASDRRIELFENVHPVPDGISYNSYVIKDEKTALLDTADSSVSKEFLENLKFVLNGAKLDYIVVNHVEPDHCATLKTVLDIYPEAEIVCDKIALKMINQFFDTDLSGKTRTIGEGEILSLGSRELKFIMAPMVHWPETMVTYDTKDKILFSGDAFGAFGALAGNLFADETDFKEEKLCEARRYYTNIVGKYGTQVQALLKKTSGIEINMICPLHGPVWRSDISWYIDKYNKWSLYEPEEKTVVIFYGSIYGNTENGAYIFANELAEKSVKNIKMYDVSKTHFSYLISEAFRASHLVVACSTYNAGIFVNMETFLNDLKAHGLKNRKIAVIENGSWAPTSGTLIKKLFSEMKDMTLIAEPVRITSAVNAESEKAIKALADKTAEDFTVKEITVKAGEIDNKAMFKLSYGLFVLSAKEGEKDNGCIINTVTQLTDNPKVITIAVNKANYTNGMILRTKKFNVSVLSESAPFDLFKRFGFASGRDKDKFDGFDTVNRSVNEIYYVTEHANSFLSAEITDALDYGTHTLFVAKITEAQVLSNEKSATYEYYFANIKPKPQPAEKKIKGWRCKICGYIYEGEELPPDFICPICKHGAEDFERIE